MNPFFDKIDREAELTTRINITATNSEDLLSNLFSPENINKNAETFQSSICDGYPDTAFCFGKL